MAKASSASNLATGAQDTLKRRKKKEAKQSLSQPSGSNTVSQISTPGSGNDAKISKKAKHVFPMPPPGFTFLSVGYSDILAKCREIAADVGAEIKPVSAPGATGSHLVIIASVLHRIGYHIPSDIFDEACAALGYRIVDGKIIKDEPADLTLGFERTFARLGADISQLGGTTASEEESQKVKGAIRELFPRIPEASLDSIFKTAWQKGAGTVGHAEELPLARRVQLAVGAHIRHVFTDYDFILQYTSWAQARKAVEPYVLAKLIEWRGEDDGGIDMEQVLRQTIMLADDESSPENSEPDRYADNEDSSDAARAARRRPAPVRAIIPTQGGHPQMLLPAQASQSQSVSPAAPSTSIIDVVVALDSQGRPPEQVLYQGLSFTRVPLGQVAASAYSVSPAQPFQTMNTSAPMSAVQPQLSHTPIPPSPFPQGGAQNLLSQIPNPATGQLPHHHQMPTRLFDQNGREVFIDMAAFNILPALPPAAGNAATNMAPPPLPNSITPLSLGRSSHQPPQMQLVAGSNTQRSNPYVTSSAGLQTQPSASQSVPSNHDSLRSHPRVWTVSPKSALRGLGAANNLSQPPASKQPGHHPHSYDSDDDDEYDPNKQHVDTQTRRWHSQSTDDDVSSDDSYDPTDTWPTSQAGGRSDQYGNHKRPKHGAPSQIQPRQPQRLDTGASRGFKIESPMLQHGGPALIQPVQGRAAQAPPASGYHTLDLNAYASALGITLPRTQ